MKVDYQNLKTAKNLDRNIGDSMALAMLSLASTHDDSPIQLLITSIAKTILTKLIRPSLALNAQISLKNSKKNFIRMIENNGAPNTHRPKPPLKFIVEGQEYETFDQYKTGSELKQLAGIPLDTELYLSIQKPYQDELIENEKSVNLARPEVEYFFIKKKLQFTINRVVFTWYKQYIRGIQIRELGQIPDEHDIYLDLPGGWKDDRISNDEVVDLARPGVEHFVSRSHENSIELIVNGSRKPYNEPKITYEKVVELAFGVYNQELGYKVKYTNGPHQNPRGMLAKGAEVFVKNNMNFHVTDTYQS